MPTECNVATNGELWYNISSYREVCPFIAPFEPAQHILVNFQELSLNWLHMSFDDTDLHTLHDTSSNDMASFRSTYRPEYVVWTI